MPETSPQQMLLSISQVKQYKSGQLVFSVGDRADSIYQVLHGEIQLYRDDVNGQRILLHRAFDGNFFAEASIDTDRYHCTALCVEDCELLAFRSSGLKRLLDRNPSFAHFWVSHLSRELRRQRANVERLSLNSAIERVVHYLMTEGEPAGVVKLKGTVSDLADMLGLSREALYRTLATMRKQGMLRQQGKVMQLKARSGI